MLVIASIDTIRISCYDKRNNSILERQTSGTPIPNVSCAKNIKGIQGTF